MVNSHRYFSEASVDRIVQIWTLQELHPETELMHFGTGAQFRLDSQTALSASTTTANVHDLTELRPGCCTVGSQA